MALVCAGALALGLTGVSPIPAHAEACDGLNCGQLSNTRTSEWDVLVADNFGASEPPASAAIVPIVKGTRTAAEEDWDAFEVPAGTCATYVFGRIRRAASIHKIDQRTGPTVWIKFPGFSPLVHVELDKTCTWRRAG